MNTDFHPDVRQGRSPLAPQLAKWRRTPIARRSLRGAAASGVIGLVLLTGLGAVTAVAVLGADRFVLACAIFALGGAGIGALAGALARSR